MRRRLPPLAVAGALALAVGAALGGGADPRNDLVLDSRSPRELTVPRFVERGRAAGIAEPHAAAGCSGNVAGVAAADVDADGHVDLFFPQYAARERLYLGDGRGRFHRASPGVGDVPLATGAAFADYDNDGDRDLYVASHAQDHLFAGDGRGRFVDVTVAAGLVDAGRDNSVAWADVDRDGWLDLYVASGDNCGDPVPSRDRLYRNVGGRFVDMSSGLERAGATTRGIGLQAAFSDLDRDGDQDLYLANDALDFEGNGLWRNDTSRGGRWRLTPVGEAWRADLFVSSMGVGLGDLDADGRTDLAISDEGPPWALLGTGDGFRRARLPAAADGAEPPTWGLAAADFDNDGDEDLFAAAGALGLRSPKRADLLYLNDGQGRFVEVGRRAGMADPGRGRGAAVADLDGDGRLDLVVARLGQRPLLYLNRSRAGRAVVLRLEARSGQADACGAQVLVSAGSRRWMRELDCGSEGFASQGEPIVHVGVGRRRRVDSIEVRWPSGRRQVVGPVRAGWRAALREPR